MEATKLRVMDVIGLSLAGAETAFGKATRDAVVALSPAGPCHILGFGDRVGVTSARASRPSIVSSSPSMTTS